MRSYDRERIHHASLRGRSPPLDPKSDLATDVRRQLGIGPGRAESFALMDRPTLDRFCRLLEAATVADNHAEPVARRRRRPDKPASTFDPFLALSSFANVVEALVFYDRVLVLYGDVERRMRDLLGTDSPVAQVPSDFSTGEQGYFLDPLMMIAALGDLDDATKDGSPLIERLKAHWTRLLPSLKWPSHSLDGYSEMFPARTNLAVFDQMINPAWDIFALRDVDHQWVGPEQGQLQKLVLANDARTLFYSRVAANLRFALAEDGNARVRYVGGPLRTPMIRALAELAEAALEPEEAVRAEDLLSEAWASARPGEGMAVPMPVWFEAVLSRARTRSDVPAVIAEYRKAAEPFRRRRDKIEEASRKTRWAGTRSAPRNLAGRYGGVDQSGHHRCISCPRRRRHRYHDADTATGVDRVWPSGFSPRLSGGNDFRG